MVRPIRLIQLVPEAAPNRVKIGFADNVEKRLSEHKTAAPTAKTLKAWPCKRSWDYAAMDSITREGCKLVLNEVIEGDIKGFIERGDRFFAVMPTPDSERTFKALSAVRAGRRRNGLTREPGTHSPPDRAGVLELARICARPDGGSGPAASSKLQSCNSPYARYRATRQVVKKVLKVILKIVQVLALRQVVGEFFEVP